MIKQIQLTSGVKHCGIWLSGIFHKYCEIVLEAVRDAPNCQKGEHEDVHDKQSQGDISRLPHTHDINKGKGSQHDNRPAANIW